MTFIQCPCCMGLEQRRANNKAVRQARPFLSSLVCISFVLTAQGYQISWRPPRSALRIGNSLLSAVQLRAGDARASVPRTQSGSSVRIRMYAEKLGQVLVTRDGAERVLGDEFRAGVAILVTEQCNDRTKALILNRPTPLLLSHLDLPRFHAFGPCRLFLGGVLDQESELQDNGVERPHPMRRKNVTGGQNLLSNIPRATSGSFERNNMSPHHWIHTIEGLKGATRLGVGNIFCGNHLTLVTRHTCLAVCLC